MHIRILQIVESISVAEFQAMVPWLLVDRPFVGCTSEVYTWTFLYLGLHLILALTTTLTLNLIVTLDFLNSSPPLVAPMIRRGTSSNYWSFRDSMTIISWFSISLHVWLLHLVCHWSPRLTSLIHYHSLYSNCFKNGIIDVYFRVWIVNHAAAHLPG